MKAQIGLSLRINAPAIFTDPAFVAWLNNGAPKFTWHQGGQPSEYSDVIVLVEPNLAGEGSDSDMPEHIWSKIVDTCRQHFGEGQAREVITVRLTNLEE